MTASMIHQHQPHLKIWNRNYRSGWSVRDPFTNNIEGLESQSLESNKSIWEAYQCSQIVGTKLRDLIAKKVIVGIRENIEPSRCLKCCQCSHPTKTSKAKSVDVVTVRNVVAMDMLREKFRKNTNCVLCEMLKRKKLSQLQ